MRKLFYILSMAFILSGCGSSSRQEEVVKENLSSTLLPVSSLIGLPLQIMVQDSFLLVNDFYGDTLVHCLSLQTGAEVGKWGVRGDAPGEIMPPLHLFKSSDSIFAFSRPLWTVCSAEGKQPHVELKEGIRLSADVSLVYPLGDSAYLASGMFSDKRFCLLDKQGNEKARFGDYPSFWSREHDLPIEVKRMFHQVRGDGFSSKHGFAVAGSHVLSLYRPASCGYSVFKEVLLAPYEYNFKNKGIESVAKLKPSYAKGVVSLAASDEFIYLLFDGNVRNEADRANKEIWCYDWEGNLLNKYFPDVDVALITVTSDGRLIGLTDAEESAIVLFAI